MQRQVQSSFDMWHDYFALGRVLETLHNQDDGGLTHTEGPDKEAASSWSHVQKTSQRGEHKHSTESSSVWSLDPLQVRCICNTSKL
ncbi:hypothetical protein PBY51_013973 [Eleginops maclovinus]|uniref:Uncharacterized protein n=1 Tax=Eleginops maclovinus TaxID=56733 RepID=A0AAN8A3N8_ELEMC|nr:hypothetical protein PBY51_013973 [Eleginops maclovinus]